MRRLARGFGLIGLGGLLAVAAGACLDLREFAGVWAGPRIGADPVLRAGFAADATATLTIESATLHTLRARLTTSGGELQDSMVLPLPAAEADVLGDITFAGAPARVFLSFVPPADGGGDALLVVALYADPRVEVRVLRGGPAPLYGIFALARGEGS